MKKEIRTICKKLRKQGFTTHVTAQGHITVRKDGLRVSTLPATLDSDPRTRRNVLGDLKNIGYIP